MENLELNQLFDEYPYLLYRAQTESAYRAAIAIKYYGVKDLDRLGEDIDTYAVSRYGEEPYKEPLQAGTCGAGGGNGEFYLAILEQIKQSVQSKSQ